MKSPEPDIMWRGGTANLKSFVGLFQIFTDKTFATLKAGSFSAYPIHICFLNVNWKARQYLIDHGYTLVGFLPTKSQLDKNIRYTSEVAPEDVELEPLEEEMKVKSDSKGRNERMVLLHEAMLQILEPMAKLHIKGFPIIGQHRKWICHPMLISYCCDIPEAKDMFCIRHGIITNRPCVMCISTTENMKKLLTAAPRTIDDTRSIREWSGPDHNKENCARVQQDKLKERSLAEYKSFMEELYDKYSSFIVRDVYSIYTFECLHNLLLGISPLLKICLFQYLSSDIEVRSQKNGKNIKIKLSQLKESLLRGANCFLANIDEKYPLSGKRVDFSRQEHNTGLNGLFLKKGVRGMLEGKDWKNIDMVFPFVAGFIDRVTGARMGGCSQK